MLRKNKRRKHEIYCLNDDINDNTVKFEPQGGIEPEKELIQKSNRHNLRKAISKLQEKYKIPIVLYYFKDLKYEDIAQILKIPVGTVKSRVYAGKNKLKEILEKVIFY